MGTRTQSLHICISIVDAALLLTAGRIFIPFKNGDKDTIPTYTSFMLHYSNALKQYTYRYSLVLGLHRVGLLVHLEGFL